MIHGQDETQIPQGDILENPIIATPVEGEVRGPVVTVSGYSLDITTIIDVYEIYSDGSRRWCGIATIHLPLIWMATIVVSSGKKAIVAQYRSKGIDSNVARFTYVYEPPGPIPTPTIESPASAELVERDVILNGKGLFLAGLRIYRDFSDHELGRSVVGFVGNEQGPDPNAWRMKLFLDPGPCSLAAEQTFPGRTSLRSVVLLKVRPPALTEVSVTYPTFTTVRFSGTGHTDATIEITIIKGPAGATAPPVATVAAGRWTTTSRNWPIGEYDLKVVQNVSDNASGSIPSREYLFKVSSTLPSPTDVAYTVSDHTPTFTGKGVIDASVEITDKANGSPVAPAVTVTAQGWSVRASEPWAPGSARTVLVRQKLGNATSGAVERIINIDLFPAPTDMSYTVVDYKPILTGRGVSGATVQVTDRATGAAIAAPAPVTAQRWSTQAFAQWEPNTTKIVLLVQRSGVLSSEPVEMSINVALVAPLITEVEDDGLSPKISGTCWPGATLILKYSDSATEHKPVNTSGTWTFKRGAGFAPEKEHTVTVFQTAAGRPSPPASQTFSVRPEQPVITEPSEDADSHYDMIVRGINGYNGATLQLRDVQFDRDLGEPKRLTANGDWFIELKKLEFRKYQIDATQTIAGRESRRSAVRSYFVRLLPPIIEVPAQNQSLTRTSTFSGTGEPFGQVTIWRENPSEILCPDIPINTDGRWYAKVTLPVGNYNVKAIQTFQTHISKYSPSRTYKVVPAAPVIESPGRGVHIGRSVVVSGFGYPQDVVEVTLTGSKGTQRKSSPVLEDRTWSLRLEADQAAGNCDLVAVSSSDGFESATSVAHPVVLGTFLPGIDEPAPGSWVENPLRFVGKGRTGVGRVVTWYDPEKVLHASIAVTNQGWRGEATQALPPGGNWCRFQQTITDAADGSTLSDWVESERFDMTSLPPGTQP